MTEESGQEAAPGCPHAPQRPDDKDRDLLQAQLQAARRVADALFESAHPDEVIETALRTAVEVFGAEGGSILLADEQAQTLVFRHSLGVRRIPAGTAIPWEEGIAGSVFHSRTPAIIPDATRDGRHYKGIDVAVNYVTRDIIAVPLQRWDGTTTGVLELLNKREGAFGARDLLLLGVVADIAATAIERARLHEDARLAEIARLFGEISHDIKNLLGPVIAGAEIIAESLATLRPLTEGHPDRAVESSLARCTWAVEALDTGARRTQELLKEISDCIHGAAVQAQFAPCRLEPLVAEVFTALKTSAAQGGVTLESRCAAAPAEIVVDERLLFSALYNLVNNALPEVPPGGSVTVAADADPGRGGLTITVADTGGGMAPELVGRLFSDHIASRKRLGTGLGLRIVKSAVEAHGGSIAVESAPGVGTTFRIFLPGAAR